MGIFDPSLDKIKGMYHRAWIESGRGAVNPREYEYLNKELLRNYSFYKDSTDSINYR